MMNLSERLDLEEILRREFRVDWGHGDVTSRLTIPPKQHGRARIRAKQRGVLAGAHAVELAAMIVGGEVRVVSLREDGTLFEAGTVIAELEGNVRALLALERVTLNVLQHLSGVATLTRQYVAAVEGTRARIVDTRKTLPGLRSLQKYAVRVGGGHNHRFHLADGILIKNNHIAAVGGVQQAVELARKHGPHTLRVEVECRSLDQVDEALAAGAEAILLDNMDLSTLRLAVERVGGRAITEASGGVTLATVRAIAETGVDLISVGALTHSAPAVDLHMLVEQ